MGQVLLLDSSRFSEDWNKKKYVEKSLVEKEKKSLIFVQFTNKTGGELFVTKPEANNL